MISIDQLDLHLPSNLASRAKLISNMIQENLQNLSINDERNIDKLELQPIEASAHTPSREIAEKVTQQIVQHLSEAGE